MTDRIPVKDYKRLNNNNKGPNTGGMGSITDENNTFNFLTEKDLNICKKINEKVLYLLKENFGGLGYLGVLYGSFIKSDNQIKIKRSRSKSKPRLSK